MMMTNPTCFVFIFEIPDCAVNPQIQKNMPLKLFCAFNPNLSGKKYFRVKRTV